MTSQRTLFLYTTSGCSLCEQARELIEPVLGPLGWPLRAVDIAESNPLLQRYQTAIPVIQDATTGAELYWPFDEPGFRRWLNQISTAR